jgi:hypothetical protein
MSAATRLVPPANEPTALLLSRVKGVRQQREGWVARCPAHDDDVQSLSIKTARDGKVLAKCHAGCSFNSIMSAAGLEAADMFPLRERVLPFAPGNGKGHIHRVPVAQYDYTDIDGKLLFQTCRYEPKTFRQRRPVGCGEWVWDLEGIEPVLYRLPEIVEAIALGRRVYIVEGEKDADALVTEGLTATTSPMGAGKGKWRESMSQIFRDAHDVVILPDNDEPGRNHARLIANSLLAVGATVRLVQLPGLPEKGDTSDWLDAGGTIASLERLASEASPCTIVQSESNPKSYSKNTFAGWKADATLLVKPRYVVPKIALAARSTFLAAREKLGKSTIMRHGIAAATRGRGFLGEPCSPVRALWVGVEEHIGDQVQGFDVLDPHPDNLVIVPELNGMKDLTELVSDEHFDIAVIDTWISFTGPVITDASSSAQSAPIMQAITNLAHRTQTAIVVLGHGRKSDGQPRDTSALTAGVDLICVMLPPSDADARRDPTLRTLEIKGRGIPQSFVPIHLTGPGASTYELARSLDLSIDVLALQWVQEHPGCSSRNVADGIGKRGADVFHELVRLEEGGVLENRGSASGKQWHSTVRPVLPDVGGD